MFQGDGVTKEHFQAHENKLSKQRSMQAIRMRLKTLVGTETDVSELLKMNPRFLLKHPNWPQATAAKLREANPSITNQEVADTLTDMLRMKRMKQQARILATKGARARPSSRSSRSTGSTTRRSTCRKWRLRVRTPAERPNLSIRKTNAPARRGPFHILTTSLFVCLLVRLPPPPPQARLRRTAW